LCRIQYCSATKRHSFSSKLCINHCSTPALIIFSAVYFLLHLLSWRLWWLIHWADDIFTSDVFWVWECTQACHIWLCLHVYRIHSLQFVWQCPVTFQTVMALVELLITWESLDSVLFSTLEMRLQEWESSALEVCAKIAFVYVMSQILFDEPILLAQFKLLIKTTRYYSWWL
jgi:hypothetical protein